MCPIPEKVWNQINDYIMFQATYAKYRQLKELRKVLLSTKGHWLIELKIHDGIGAVVRMDRIHHESVDFVLMEVRRVLAAKQQENDGKQSPNK